LPTSRSALRLCSIASAKGTSNEICARLVALGMPITQEARQAWLNSDDGTLFFVGNDTSIVSKHVDAEVQRDKAIERFQEARKRFVQFMEKEGKTNGK
jgi:hypothetical protein